MIITFGSQEVTFGEQSIEFGPSEMPVSGETEETTGGNQPES